MIRRPTVFILGAGASMAYGFPSGAELRQMICQLSDANPPLVKTLSAEPSDFFAADITEFAKQFERSSIASIDAFLAKRGEFTAIGKLCIAALLCELERPERVVPGPKDDDWYSYLWNILTQDVESPEELAQNRIKFVSFNYDRSLQYF